MSRTTTYLLILNGAICGFFIIYAFILGHFFYRFKNNTRHGTDILAEQIGAREKR